MLLKEQSVSINTGQPRKKLDIIQVLRGVAAMMVIVFHIKGVLPDVHLARRPLDFLFGSGPAGVDLFFVLSGFIMVFVTYRLVGGLRSAGLFLLKRFLRIWPLYAIVTISYLLINYRYAIPAHLWAGVARSLAFIPLSMEQPPFYGYPFLSVGWSLNYEIYFYLLLGISLLTKSLRWIVFFSLIGITLIFIPLINHSFSFNEETTGNYDYVYMHMITNPIIWNFVFGVLIGLSYMNAAVSSFFEKIFRIKLVSFLAVGGLICFYLSNFSVGHGPLEWGLEMALLVLVLIFYDKVHSPSYPPWLVYLGDISFSLYLWHLPVLSLVNFTLFKLSLEEHSDSVFSFCLMMVLTLWVSHYSYQYLEKRFVRVLR